MISSDQWRDLSERIREVDMGKLIRLRREMFEEEHRLRHEFHHRLAVACYEAQKKVYP